MDTITETENKDRRRRIHAVARGHQRPPRLQRVQQTLCSFVVHVFVVVVDETLDVLPEDPEDRPRRDRGLDGAADTINVQDEQQKQLDIIANEVLKDALRYTGKVGLAASEEEADPMLVEEAFGSKYVAVFDPLDGSSNVQAAVATGTIFGIFRQNVECLIRRPATFLRSYAIDATRLDQTRSWVFS